MFLSNRHVAALSIALNIFAAAGCAWFSNSNPTTQPTAITTPASTIPFETKEPETYQADFVTIAGGAETRSHLSRKGTRSRFDSFEAGKSIRSIVQTDKLIYVDHRSKTFAEASTGGGDAQPPYLADLTASLLTQKPPAKFEKIGTDGKIERYRVTADSSITPSIISYDTEIKMVTRHEIGDGFAFEMRNFTLEVDDQVFQIPPGYRKVAWADFLKK